MPCTACDILFCVYTIQAQSDVQTVSERLSQHVLSNYSKFVTGVTEVASVEQDLQVPSPLASMQRRNGLASK